MERGGPRFEKQFLVTAPSEEVFGIVAGVAEQFSSRPVFPYVIESDGRTVSLRRRFLPWLVAYAGLVGCLVLVGFLVLFVVRNDEKLTIGVIPEPSNEGCRVTVSGLERGFWVSSSMLASKTDKLSTKIEQALETRWSVAEEKQPRRLRWR